MGKITIYYSVIQDGVLLIDSGEHPHQVASYKDCTFENVRFELEAAGERHEQAIFVGCQFVNCRGVQELIAQGLIEEAIVVNASCEEDDSG